MSTASSFARLSELKIIPVVAIQDADQAERLADALVEGGLPCAEITFRTAAAAEAIRRLAKRSDFLVGAGTLVSTEQVQTAADAGAKFFVSPGFSSKVVTYCIERKLEIFPGVCTPSEVMQALDHGLKVVKFFPAENYGGVKTIEALSGPFKQVKFIPTGGISNTNLLDYLQRPAVAACGASWMVKPELLAAGDFAAIAARTREAIQLLAKLSPK